MAKNSPDSGYPDGDHLNGGDPKAFYENLPFHGAPLKQVSLGHQLHQVQQQQQQRVHDDDLNLCSVV